MSSKTNFKPGRRLSGIILAAILLAVTVFAALPSASAETSEGVKKCMDSVLQIRMQYQPDKSDEIVVSSGSCFVVNSSTVLTCAHIFEGNEIVEYTKKTYGNGHKFDREKNGKKIEVLVNGGAPVPATIKKIMVKQDYAILKLDENITRPSVTFGSSADSEVTDNISTLGFPTLTGMLQDSKTYSNDQMSVSTSTITSKTTTDGVKYFMHDAIIANGASGGPLVNESGQVIGINLYQDKASNSSSNYFRAIETDQILAVFDDLGYEYSKVNGTGTNTEETTVGETSEAVETTVAPATTQAVTDPTAFGGTNNNNSNGPDIKLIIIIAIAVVIAVIIIVILIIIFSGKKKKDKEKSAASRTPSFNGMNPPGGYPGVNGPAAQPPVPPYTPARPNPVVPAEGASETTVLNGGEGETSVLGGQTGGFKMKRRRNNETINIDRSDFIIGKERRKVSYCISDNNSVSRTHARIRVRSGRCYLSDLGSTNCTYINGTKLTPNQEVVLSPGDKIKISDEEFEFIG
ncbi:MAG: trypsin-like peptidase domain-containing protein [Ruminococcus sp.]|nr:trypsin-like peptidase domain-containing protein [Ruminococcus sp.]